MLQAGKPRNQGSGPDAVEKIVSSSKRPFWLQDPRKLLSVGHTMLFPGVKRPRREADYSYPSSVQVNNACSRTSAPTYIFRLWCLIVQTLLPISLFLPFFSAFVCQDCVISRVVDSMVYIFLVFVFIALLQLVRGRLVTI